MCYREGTSVLDLTGIHVACLSGENGAGKSALLEAMTWALWGKARARTLDDELISKGASDMEVDYHFVLGGQHYRVIRKRARKGSGGTTMLDVQVSPTGEEGTWRSMSGGTVRETQARINQLLKLDYDTFINSSFIMQGRADEFTVKNPAERKQVLADILGLEQYDRLEELAKEEVRQRKARIQELDIQISRIAKQLEERPDVQHHLEELEHAQAQAQHRLNEAREALAELLAEKQHLEYSRQQLEQYRSRLHELDGYITAAEKRIGQHLARKGGLEQILARREEIERGYAEWQSVQAQVAHYESVLEALRPLERQQSELEHEISSQAQNLRLQIQFAKREIENMQGELAARPALEQQLAEVLGMLDRLEALQRQHRDTRCQRDNLQVKYQNLSTEITDLERAGKEIRQKLDLLTAAHADGKGHADCPLCGTRLGEDAMERVRRSFEQDIAEKRESYNQKRKERDAIKTQLVEVERRLGEEEQQLASLEQYRNQRAELDHKLQQLAETERQLEGKKADLARIEAKLEQGDYAHEARQRLAAVKAEIERLAYDEQAHRNLKERLAELKGHKYDDLYDRLQIAEPALEAVLEELEQEERLVEAWKQQQEAIRKQEIELTPRLARLAEISEQYTEKQTEVAALDRQVRELEGAKGELKNKLKQYEELEVEKKEREAERQSALDEKVIYEELSTAFGKKGIQAMIIENVIPEVEDETNALLSRMTDGRMSVQFITQRDAKATKGVIETLDINIADEMGTRAYELYSGGEAFRVNFAMRIALSKLLARRAGAQLQTLVIDEGFGSQDGQGREKLIGAIRSIQDEFEKILVITHIEELKDEFPVRINIIKTGTGSKIVMDEGD
jgi:exonuclease SbcC